MNIKQTIKMFGIVVMIIAAITVSAGCTSTQQAGNSSNESSVHTTPDLVRALYGKATVSGDTIVLTEGVRLENASLIVPLGVTLDLTKEALQLGNNVIFTVDGAVNAKAEGIIIDSTVENPATINGNGIIYLKSKGRLFGVWEGRKLVLDGVTLVGLKDNNESLMAVGNGGEFVMKSGKIMGNTLNGDIWGNGGGIIIIDGSTFTMQGGMISCNTTSGSNTGNAGGVRVSRGTFIMQGGTISGNTAISGTNGSSGGGVQVNQGVFIMEGGTIYGKVDSLPSGTDAGLANSARNASSLRVWETTAKWGTGGTYTKGGIPQTGGSNILPSEGNSDDTLIAIPAQ